MAGGKLSPRQKMINMMYLVLTALLALNVSKEILDAFVVVNIGLLQQKENLEQKNRSAIDLFNNEVTVNPKNERIKGFQKKADEIGKISTELAAYIEQMKVELVRDVDGVDETVAKERVKNPYQVEKKDDYDKPTEFFGTNNEPGDKGKANELKNKLVDYKAKLMNYVEGKNKEQIAKNLAILNTNNPLPEEKLLAKTWEMKYFYHLPLSAALTELTKWQNIVRGAESELLTHLWDQISATSFKFDAVEAKIVPKSSFVISGANFEAEVFLAAFSTSFKPTIMYGSGVDSTTGKVEGAVELPADKIIQGKGMISIPVSGNGEKIFAGTINMKDPVTGQDKPYPFSTVYNVSPPSATVSPTKMNVFYRGLDNPISVSVPGVAPNNIVVNCSGGSISGGNGNYIVKPGTGNQATISVSARMPDGKTTSMGSFPFRVKRVPDPTIVWGGQKSGSKVAANTGAASPLIPQMQEFDFEVYSVIRSFEVSFNVNGSLVTKQVTGNQLPGDISSKVRSLSRGSKVFFDNIKVSVPGNETRTLVATYTIQ